MENTCCVAMDRALEDKTSERLDPVIASEPRCHAVTGALLMHDITVTSQRNIIRS